MHDANFPYYPTQPPCPDPIPCDGTERKVPPGASGPGRAETPLPPPIAPLRYCPGMNVQEQLNNMANRVNVCIDRWNKIQANCYAMLNQVVGAAVNNSVYYAPDEVMLSDGYSEEEGCGFKIVEARSVDRSGKPIFCKLRPAYNSVVNSGAREAITDVSFVVSGQVVMSASQVSYDMWRGASLFAGNPGNSQPDAEVYVAGWTRGGALRFFQGDVTVEQLCQNQMFDCIGPVYPVLLKGELFTEGLEKIPNTPGSIQAMGWKQCNGNKVFFSCSDYDDKGMTPTGVANVLKNMGCTNAVITAYSGVTESGNVTERALSETTGKTGGLAFIGELVTAPSDWEIPRNTAFWTISKRPTKGWNNQFTTEVASTSQRLGITENNMKSILGQMDSTQDNIDKVQQQVDDLQTEVNNISGDFTEISGQVTDLNNKVTELESTISNTETAITNLTERVNANTENIGNLTTSVGDLQKKVEDENQALSAAIAAESSTRESQDRILDNKIATETAYREAAISGLQANISSEELARKAEDLQLQQKIDQEITERTEAISDLETQVNTDKTDIENIKTGEALPVASTTQKGIVKIGANLTIDADGTLSAIGGGGGDVTINQGQGIDVTRDTETGAYTISVNPTEVASSEEVQEIDTRLTAVETAQTDTAEKDRLQDEKITELENKNTSQDTAITTVTQTASANSTEIEGLWVQQ